MRRSRLLWAWHALWLLGLLAAAGLWLTYRRLPADGATGDLNSFTPRGYVVQWLLEERPNGLQVGDVIVRAGGHTVEEWLAGVAGRPEWRTGDTVAYEIVRGERSMRLDVLLEPISFQAVLRRWTPQYLVALAFLGVGLLVFLRRRTALPNRLMMLFCVSMSVQYWGDAYNLQFATAGWGWPLWLQVGYEHVFYGLSVASVVYFLLVFPARHPVLERYPRLVPALLYLSFPLIIGTAMLLSPDWSAALRRGNQVTWAVVVVQAVVAAEAAIRSLRTARDPVTRAQIRWILWAILVAMGIMMPGYALPLMLGRPPLLSHPALMILIALVPITLGVAILRHRLFDIDVIMNATLVYGTLSTLLAGLYLVLVRVLSTAIRGPMNPEDQSLILFLATMGGALAFEPLRRRVQGVIDRTFYRTRLDSQRLLMEMNERVATSLEPDRLNALLTEELPARLHIAWAALAILDPDESCIRPPVTPSHCPALPTDHPLVTYLAGDPRPVMRLQPPPRLPAAGRELLEGLGIELSIPLVVQNELVGVYHLGPKRSGDAYYYEELRLLQLLGQQAGVAVENSRLLSETERQAKEMAVAEERQKLARDLHDAVSQTLFSASLIADVLPQLWERQPQLARRSLAELRDLAHGAQAEMRALLVELRPQALLEGRLDVLLGYLARAVAGRSGVRVEVEVEGECRPLPPDVHVTLYRIAQEALNNVAKHARAERALVSLVFLEAGEGVELGIDDDGRGFDAEVVPPERLGLKIMHERARAIGAELTIQSVAGEGTSVALTWLGE